MQWPRTHQERCRAVEGMLKCGSPQAPRHFVEHVDGGGTRWLLFLAPHGGAQCIFRVEIDTNDSKTERGGELLFNAPLFACESKLTKEEELLRERQRNRSFGISSFILDRACSTHTRLFVPAGGAAVFCVDIGSDSHHKAVSIQLVVEQSPILNLALSDDGKLLAFVSSNDVYVMRTPPSPHATEDSRSHGVPLRCTEHDRHKRDCGVAEYIMQEEFDRYTGLFWRPTNDGKNHMLLYAEVDESAIPMYHMQANGIEGHTESSRYALAGAPNAYTVLATLDVQESTEHESGLRSVRRIMWPSLHRLCGWAEYIPRLGWRADGKGAWAMVLDRAQQHCEIVGIDLNMFVDESAVEEQSIALEAALFSNRGHAPQRKHRSLPPETQDSCFRADDERCYNTALPLVKVFQETTSVWINVTNAIYVFEDGRGMLVASELDTGFRHLYLLTPSGDDGDSLWNKRAITMGHDWQVDDCRLVVTEEHDLVFFEGTKDSCLEKHLYVASLRSDADPERVLRLTEGQYYHEVSVAKDAKSFVTTYSNLNTPYRTAYFSLDAAAIEKSFLAKAHAVELSHTIPLYSFDAEKHITLPIVPPEPYSLRSSTTGHLLHGVLYKPPDFDATKKYPLLVYVYGGPHAQLVRNSYFMTVPFIRLHFLSLFGVVVSIVDNVGAARRGLRFESHIQHSMGTVEVADQVDAVKHLIDQGFIDQNRVAVTGTSYGGYMSLMCLARRPDIFKHAISCAPVTCWEAYDTGYTERYMDLPMNNAEGYAEGSVLHHSSKFPNDMPRYHTLTHLLREGRLTVIHGLIDEKYERRGCAVFCLCVERCCGFLSRFPQGRFTRELCITLEMGAHVSLIMIPSVHWCNTSELLSELIKNLKPHEAHVYPQERHGVRTHSTGMTMYYARLLTILEKL